MHTLNSIRNIIAVASGKGGVGKSTLSANLALALSAQGYKVGLMDADVYGPSIPTILGITEKPLSSGGHIFPVQAFGISVISMGFFVPANEAVIWRGPMLNKMIQDFLGHVEWGELDYLVIDLPPGTGDVQLSLCQSASVTGALIVSTPQDLAWSVAQKAIVMFDKLNVPILGIVENMSYFVCSNCSTKHEIFGHKGTEKAAAVLEIPFLGEIALEPELREASDNGKPMIRYALEHAVTRDFSEIAKKLDEQVKGRAHESGSQISVKKTNGAGHSEVLVEWSDGKLSIFSAKDLRVACPCAACVDEFSGKKLLDPQKIPQDLKAASIQTVGRYALHIAWSDGHSTGLYGYKYLRKLSLK